MPNNNEMKREQAERIYIFDTTLRDGQQSPGAGLTFEDNLIYADYADQLNVDILEAGFPSASQTDFYIVKSISERMAARKSNMVVAGLCQLREGQVIKTIESLAGSIPLGKARVHTYVPVDPSLAKASLGHHANHDEIIKTVYKLIKMAKDAGCEVEFSPEGYSRLGDHFDYVGDLVRAAVEAGASVINCPDTIGGACRREGEQYFVRRMQRHADMIQKEFPNHPVIWSTHNHNDFGLALDNSINAVFEGPARQIEGCINGVGERAGNAALEQCVMYIKQFGQKEGRNFYTDINISEFKQTSDFIAEKMLPRQPHSPIVGENATKHTSGGHTNAILNNPLVYQPFDPKEIGGEIRFVFGPLSGGNHAKQVIEQHGYICENEEKATMAQAIKDYYHDRRKGVTDLEVLAAYKAIKSPIKADKISYSRVNGNSATLSLIGAFFDQSEIEVDSLGKNSALSALVEAVKTYMPDVKIEDYRSESSTDDAIDALCRSTIVVSRENNRTYKGIAEDSDIEISALKAYINAVNEAYVEEYYRIGA
jgi:2-isopropylmalate synthase